VLIAYGTRYGSTEEISNKIAEILERKGFATQLLDLKNTEEREWPPLKFFQGVLVGSGIRGGKWVKEPKKFLEKNEEFKSKTKIFGLFISSGYASFPEKKPEIEKDYLEKVMAKLGVEADIYSPFGGLFDFSESSRMNFFEKKLLKTVLLRLAKDMKKQIDEKTRIDLRDWDEIHRFAEDFAKILS